MHYKRNGYFEEDELGKPYDIKLLKRIYPFVVPYRLFLIGAILLIILITLIDLSVPYISKIAIDRYIVPKDIQSDTENQHSKIRYFRADMTDSEIEKIVRKYPKLFRIYDGYAMILFDDLPNIEKKDRAILRKDDMRGMVLVAVVFIGAALVNFILNFIQVMIMEYTGQRVMYDLRLRLFSHIQSLSVSFFTRNSVGRLVTRVTNDVQNMQDVFSSIIVFIFKDLLLIIGVTAILLSINWKLAFASFTVVPLIVYASLFFARQSRKAFRILKVKIADISSRFSETVGGIKIIQLFMQEKNNYLEFEKLNHEHYLAGMKLVGTFAVFMRFMGFLDVFVVALVIFYGGGRVLDGVLSLGELVAFLAYMKMFFAPIQDIAQKYNVMQNAMSSAERIFLILDSKEKLPELGVGSGKLGVGSGKLGVGSGELGVGSGELGVGSGELGVGSGKLGVGSGELGVGSGKLGVGSGKLGVGSGKLGVGSGKLGVGSGELGVGSGKLGVATHTPQPTTHNPQPTTHIKNIEMDNVSFAYIEDEEVLDEISFQVRAGETIAIVGPTGSGKTSLINLMIRFYDPTSGRVLVNGKDVKEWDVSALRSKMALVTQDPFLFSGTIGENIFQKDISVSEEEKDYILEASNCKGFVSRLEKGPDTELSEGGASISSGERQLISIARAFARNPEVIILDEATSYIDSATEEKIQEALMNLMRNRTSVIVAHRLSTTRHADRIIVLHRGKIIESGSHKALMEKKGFYFKLNLLQG